MLKPATEEALWLMHAGSLALAEVEANGFAVDVPYLKKAQVEVESKVAEIEERLRSDDIWKSWKKRFGEKAVLTNRSQLAEVLMEQGLLKKIRVNEKSQKISGDKSTLETVDSDFTRAYVDAEELKKLNSTYFKGILREVTSDGLVHPNFNLHLIISYRSSASDPNVQNIPARNPKIAEYIRRAYVARTEDRCIVEIDLSGAEVRVSACYNKDPALIKYILDPATDMHRDAACDLFFLKPEQVPKPLRHIAKNMYVFPEFYGSFYKLCAPDMWDAFQRLAITVPHKGSDVPLMEWLARKGVTSLGDHDPDSRGRPERGTFEAHVAGCEDILWNERFSVYRDWKRSNYEKYLRRGGMLTKTGFRIDGLLNRKEVSNIGIQGDAFHCALLALILAQNKIKKRKIDALIVNEVHDSIVFDCYKDHVPDLIPMVMDIIENVIPKRWPWIIVPLKAEAEVSPPGGSWQEKKTWKGSVA